MEVVYSGEHWRLLGELRREAVGMMRPLAEAHIGCLVYGSIARGDIHPKSDVDVYVPNPPMPTLVESALERAGVKPASRFIVKATPTAAAKGYLVVEEGRSYSFPLETPRGFEAECPRFAGCLGLEGLEEELRVPGVNKGLMIIEPTERGHLETPLVGAEGKAARLLGVSLSVVRQRVRVLSRRREVGHTGVYLKRELSPEESFGQVFREMAIRDPAIRRRRKP